MTQVLVTESYLDDIADAIRDKNGSEDTYTPAQMADAIVGIHTADEVVLVSKSISANGTYNPASDSADGYSGVTVNVPNTYTSADEGKVVSGGALVGQTSRNVTVNGTYDTTENNEVVVNVSGGGSSTGIIQPVYQGITYLYVTSDGRGIYTNLNKEQFMNIFSVQANHKYALFVGETISTRRRCGFFPLTPEDISPYWDTMPDKETLLFTNGIWLAPSTSGQDDTGELLKGRIIYTPTNNGIILFGTSNTSSYAPAYCIDITNY